MNADFMRYRGLFALAVGAGVMLGAAGIFIYQQFVDRRRMVLKHRTQMEQLNMTVTELRREFEELRMRATSRRPARRKANSKSMSTADSDIDTDIDMYSAIGMDDDNDIFYDFSDEDDVSGNARETESDPKLISLLDEVDRLLKGPAEDKEAALNLLLEYEHEYATNVSVLWRLAKASHMMSTSHGAEGDNDKKKELVLQGLSYATKALELDETNAEVHKWFAVTVGSRGEFLGIRERIEDGYVFKQHVDKALALRPEDPSLHHLLGRFKYEVAALSWIERKVAGTLFAEPPTATYSEAVKEFMQAESLSPTPWKENRLLLAKCHINECNYTDAMSWLDLAAQVPVNTPDDQAAESEVITLLEKYESYRQ